jgi:purine-binding chemotaxis protein CheW
MEVEIDNKLIVIGALADSVDEVIELEAEQIEPAPNIGTKVKSEFIKGMGKYNDRFLILLDLNKIFSEEDLTQIQEAKNLSEAE